MNDAVRYPLVLGIISLCSAAGLALTYSATRDEIRLQEKLRKARGQAEVLGIELKADGGELPWEEFRHEGSKGDPDGVFFVSEFTNADTGEKLYVAYGKAQGYSSKVEVVAAVDEAIEEGTEACVIRAAKVVKQLETPGLGSKCTDPEFRRQFDRLPHPQLTVVKGLPYRDPVKTPDQNVAAITGATITSNAVEGGVRMALDRIRFHTGQRKHN